jgi:predicted AAA+ superfamily ATPase
MISAKILDQLVHPGVPDNISYISEKEKIFNFRFYDINIPRQTGKTTAIQNYSKGKSVLKLRGIMSVGDADWFSLAHPDRFINNLRGLRSIGLKYNYILIDEYHESLKDNLLKIISYLLSMDMLTDDYVIVSVRTG